MRNVRNVKKHEAAQTAAQVPTHTLENLLCLSVKNIPSQGAPQSGSTLSPTFNEYPNPWGILNCIGQTKPKSLAPMIKLLPLPTPMPPWGLNPSFQVGWNSAIGMRAGGETGTGSWRVVVSLVPTQSSVPSFSGILEQSRASGHMKPKLFISSSQPERALSQSDRHGGIAFSIMVQTGA